MSHPRDAATVMAGWAAVAALVLGTGWACAPAGGGEDEAAELGSTARAAAALTPAGDDGAAERGRDVAAQDPLPHGGTPEDWAIAREKLSWALDEAHEITDFGELTAALGETFLGTAYVARTLEAPAEEGLPEGLVVNLRELDCVTFVENVLVLARLARSVDPALLDDPEGFRAAFRDELTRIRYRDGALDGYASRLHYFSEWLADNERKGVVRQVTRDIGGTADAAPVDFMSTHPDAYLQLADENALSRLLQIEAALATMERFYIPQDEIAARADQIRTGDVIAATSTVDGLDVAHTGIAVWRDGVLRLLHAPLVGSSVTLSDESLAERIGRIEGQDGIMVARPLPPRGRGGA